MIGLLLFNFNLLFCQEKLEEKLRQACYTASTDSERIFRLDHLSQFYYATKDFALGDSTIERQIMLGEASQSERLAIFTYFNNAGYQFTSNSTKDRSEHFLAYINRALLYAKARELSDYVAMAYANLSAADIIIGRSEAALKNANFAFTTALNTGNDSAKIVCAIQLGNVYQQRSEILMAFKTYTNAQNIAIETGREELLPPVFHAMATLYRKLGNDEVAKNYIHRSLAIHKSTDNSTGIIRDYISLAKMSNYMAGKEYLQQAIQIASSQDDVGGMIEAEKILFSHMLLMEKPAFMFAYLEANMELKHVFENSGAGYFDWMKAEIYLYGGRPDSAILHFRKAEPSFSGGYDLNVRKNFFGEFAYCFQLLGEIERSTEYYLRSLELANTGIDLMSLKTYTKELKSLYEQQGDYKQAYTYSLLYDRYKDSVDLLGREKDLALLEIENVTRQEQRDAEMAQSLQRRKHNLQYMLITIVVAAAFLLMIMIGMFRVSALTIRLMGFFSLIFLFEFIILVLDNRIHHLTHGEPWKIWLIKIGIISLLLPLHHFLEHRLIRYLLSRHLIIVRSRLAPASFFRKKKKPQKPDETLDGSSGS